MSGIAKYNNKSWNVYNRINTYPTDEDYVLDIYHNNKAYEMVIYADSGAVKLTNSKSIPYHAWSGWTSKNNDNFTAEFTYTAPAQGDYSIECLLCGTETITGTTTVQVDSLSYTQDIKLDDDRTNRIVQRISMQSGDHKVKLTLPSKFVLLGIVVKKIEKYTADSYLSKTAKLTMTDAKISISEKTGPSSLTCTLLYDNAYKDVTSLTGFIFDYRDEVNFHLRNTDGEISQVFGGYVSSVTLNSDETQLTLNCASRLIDGDNRTSLEAMIVGGKVENMDEYYSNNIKTFNSYAQAVKYLFESYELPLHNSISSEYINGETYEKGINIDFGSKGTGKKITGKNVIISKTNSGLTVRNKPDKDVLQQIVLYDSNWYNTAPTEISKYPTFYIHYGMGEPVKKTTTIDKDGKNMGSLGSTVTVTGKPSCACCSKTHSYTNYTTTFKNYCPNCGRSGTLRWNPKGVPEGELTCSYCDSDFCAVCGGDKGVGRCRTRKLIKTSESSNSSSTSEGTEITTTTGFDPDKPFMAYLVFEFSLTPERNAERYTAYLNFTAESPDTIATFTDLTALPLNNVTQCSTVNLLDKIKKATFSSVWNYPDKDNFKIYLRAVKMEYRTLKTLYENTDTSIDKSSYRLYLYNCGFRRGTTINPTNMETVGNTLNTTLNKLLENATYNLDITPFEHREDDKAIITMNNETAPKYTVKEGDDGNIISIADRTFNPVNDYKNHSTYTYQISEESLSDDDVVETIHHMYVVSRYPAQVLRYGEIDVTETSNENMGKLEAYQRARGNTEFRDATKDSLTVTITGYPKGLQIDDNIEVILEDSYYNDIKALKSMEIEYNWSNAPKIQTTLGLNKVTPTIQLQKDFENQRKTTRNKKVTIKETALYDTEDVFYWEE